jgi:hypothetical protein
MLLQLRRALVLSWRTKFGGKRRMVAEERAPPDSVEKTTCGVSETVAMAEAEQLGFLWRRGAGAGCSARSVAAASGWWLALVRPFEMRCGLFVVESGGLVRARVHRYIHQQAKQNGTNST